MTTNDQITEEQQDWQVGSPAWNAQQEERLQEDIDNIGSIFPETEQPLLQAPPDPNRTYTWMKDDNITLVAARLGLTRSDLLDHNDIDDPATIQVGDRLHLPIARDLKEVKPTTIEVLPEPLPMHVAKPGGCKKWSFGNMQTWDDAKSTGFFPTNTNVTIVAVAHVPIEDNGAEIEAAYYMDGLALGDYATSGRIQWAIGFMWSDLAEGHAERRSGLSLEKQAQLKATIDTARKNIPTVKKVEVKAAEPAEDDYLKNVETAFVQQRFEEALQEGLNTYKESYQELPVPVLCMAMIPESAGNLDELAGSRYIMVKEFDTKRPDRKLLQHQDVTIAGTFEYSGITYGRPLKAAQNGYWYGIPMEMLQSQAELYNTTVDAETRAATGSSLTLSERYLWVPLAKFSARVAAKKQKLNKRK